MGINPSHEILIKRESAHQDSKIRQVSSAPIRHATVKKFSMAGSLQAFFARPFLESKEPLRILELGCGTGGTAIRLAGLGHTVCSVDISHRSIEYARQGAIDAGVQNQTTFRLLDVSKLSDTFKKGEFDAVCGIGILHHLDCMKSVLEQIYDLRPKLIAFIEALGTNPLYGLVRKSLVGKSHSEDEHPLAQSDLRYIREIFPGARMLFGGAITPHHRFRVGPLPKIDHLVSNSSLFMRFAKTVAIVWQNSPSLRPR